MRADSRNAPQDVVEEARRQETRSRGGGEGRPRRTARFRSHPPQECGRSP